MTDPNHALPRLSVLTEEQQARVHAASLKILSSVGVRVDAPRALKLLAKALGAAAVEGRRVRFSSDLIQWAIDTAPASVDIYDRNGSPAFRLGDGCTRFGIGVTNLFYQDPQTDDVLPFEREHMRASVRLGNTLPNVDLVSTVGVLHDVEPDRADLVATLEMVANTTKPLVLLVSEPAQFSSVLDLLQSLCGRLSTKPFAIPYVNPVTPLVLNEGTTDKMLVTAERGLPLIFSSYGMAGTSAPITPAGSLELLNAELLAGLTLSQLINEGTPVILGILPMAFDMREMLPLFDASTFLLNVACAEMMSFYGLPHAGTSGSGEGWGADLLASGTMWANHLTSVLGRVDLCPFIGSSFGSKAFSPHAAVYADEVIAQVRRLARGFDLSEDAAPLAEVKEAGPGGDFLASDQTFQHFRDAYFRSDIFPTLDLEVWREKGSPQAAHFLRRRTRELMDQPVVPDDYAGLLESGSRFIDLI